MADPITAERFAKAMGSEPRGDDLARANCPDAGQFGHWGCGWCEHDRAAWSCLECMQKRAGSVAPAVVQLIGRSRHEESDV